MNVVDRFHCALIATGIAAALAAPAAVARQQLASTVSWLDAAGRSGESRFQGFADGAKLTGIVEIEGQTYEVVGTISSGGDVAGRLELRGRTAGTFRATMRDDEVLEGRLQLGARPESVWISPSTRGLGAEVPKPPRRLGDSD